MFHGRRDLVYVAPVSLPRWEVRRTVGAVRGKVAIIATSSHRRTTFRGSPRKPVRQNLAEPGCCRRRLEQGQLGRQRNGAKVRQWPASGAAARGQTVVHGLDGNLTKRPPRPGCGGRSPVLLLLSFVADVLLQPGGTAVVVDHEHALRLKAAKKLFDQGDDGVSVIVAHLVWRSRC